MKQQDKVKRTSIGGSALIEGVMMRSHTKTAIAVRKENGEIVLKVTENPKSNALIGKIPLVRGIVGFIASLKTSYSAMMYAADVAMEGVIEESEPESKLDRFLTKLFGKTGMAILGVIAMALGIVIGVGLFFYLPTVLVGFAEDMIPAYQNLSEVAKRIVTSVSEGMIKLAVFFLYLLAISQMKDIKRVFQYHGAEHKSIFCYEHNKELTPENAQEFRRFHPRCGTSFLFLTLLVSIVLSAFITVSSRPLRAVIRICLIPVMLGLAYECIRLAGKYDNVFTRILSAPGLWFQRLTTKEPDNSQLEIAITALNGVLREYPPEESLIVSADGEIIKTKEQEEASDESQTA